MENLNIYTFRELIKMYIDERPMPDVAFVTQTEAMKLQSMGKEMNNNSEWITDRRPIEHDEPYVYDSFGHVCHWIKIANGEPWKPIPNCEPYVKPKRWVAVYDRNYKCWAVGDRAHVTQLARLALYSACRCHLDDRADVTHLVHLVEDTDQHREAAERIAAIYEEVMP